ncbi:SH3 domain-containing protein [Kaistia adipata]|uniref:SH3 domain-containing protein n=1 Tax=Kaistia adipata TaxID=166954 RepID=UPI0003FA3F7E|nr:SH3 domain-containing protein [Kaistia adipata]
MRSLFGIVFALGFVFLGLTAPVSAQDTRTEVVKFAKGASSRTIRDTIVGRQSARYLLSVAAGQRVRVQLASSNRFNFFNVTAPGADTALFVGSQAGNSASFVAPSSGRYVIDVYLMRNAARRNETANYALTVSVAGKQAASRPSPGNEDFADGLSGGPDFWEVTGVPPGDRLNLRAAASANAAVLGTARNGAVLRNLGCRMNGGTRWCRVESRDGTRGWAAGRFLREAAG